MSFPGPKVHRASRRKLGRGQYPSVPPATVAVTGTGSTATLTFSQPLAISGTVAFTVATVTRVSQTINSPTQVTIVMSGALAGHAWTFPGGQPNLTTAQGGEVTANAGTF